MITIDNRGKANYKPVVTEYYVSGSNLDLIYYKDKVKENPKRVTNRKELPIESRTRHVVIYVLPNTPIELKLSIQQRKGIEVIYL